MFSTTSNAPGATYSRTSASNERGFDLGVRADGGSSFEQFAVEIHTRGPVALSGQGHGVHPDAAALVEHAAPRRESQQRGRGHHLGGRRSLSGEKSTAEKPDHRFRSSYQSIVPLRRATQRASLLHVVPGAGEVPLPVRRSA